MDVPSAAAAIPDLYQRKVAAWAEDRGRELIEGDWLDRFTTGLAEGSTVLDLGCGNGYPIAAALLDRGFRVTGVDVAPAMVAMAADALPTGEWIVGDMRMLSLGRRFNAVLAWHSFFHLDEGDQREALGRFIAHMAPGAALMFTSGPVAGVAMGEWRGEPLFHASLAPEEYAAILGRAGCALEQFTPGEPVAEGPSVYLFRRAPGPG